LHLVMHRTLAVAGALISAIADVSAVEAQPRVKVGILSCAKGSTTGTIFAFSKSFYCRFQRPGRDELYRGRIDRFGLDLDSRQNGDCVGRAGPNRPVSLRTSAKLLRASAVLG
jgi:Protein of unknown function (DUF992)